MYLYIHGALRNTDRFIFIVLKSYEKINASTASANKFARIKDFASTKTVAEAILRSGMSAIIAYKQAKEKPIEKPFANAIAEEARKQKYVNPEMKIKNRCLRSALEAFSRREKPSKIVSHSTKIDIKCSEINRPSI